MNLKKQPMIIALCEFNFIRLAETRTLGRGLRARIINSEVGKSD